MNPVRIADLLPKHRQTQLARQATPATRLTFTLKDASGDDVYNISAPFLYDGALWLLGRVEPRNSEHSRVGFFQPTHSVDPSPQWRASVQDIDDWTEVEAPQLELQDPFFTIFDQGLLIGGVEIIEDPETGRLNYRTAFYVGDHPLNLRRFAEGPWGMKDLRLLGLKDGRMLLLTRPQGHPGGRGTIGWTILEKLEDLTIPTIESAQLLTGQFIEEEWGGGNEIYPLDHKRVGILAHIAQFDDAGDRHYYASAFELDLASGQYSEMRIIAERRDFEEGPSKRPDLQDVIFSGGLVRRNDGTAVIYCGTGDAEAHRLVIPDPFV